MLGSCMCTTVALTGAPLWQFPSVSRLTAESIIEIVSPPPHTCYYHHKSPVWQQGCVCSMPSWAFHQLSHAALQACGWCRDWVRPPPPPKDWAGIDELDSVVLCGLHMTDIYPPPPKCLMPIMMWVGFDILLPLNAPHVFYMLLIYAYCCETNVFLFRQIETASAQSEKLLGETATCTCGSNNTWNFLS